MENFDPSTYVASSYAELELEDKYSATLPANEDVSIFVMHHGAHILLRRYFINELRALLPDISAYDLALESALFNEDEILVCESLKPLNEKLLFLDFEFY